MEFSLKKYIFRVYNFFFPVTTGQNVKMRPSVTYTMENKITIKPIVTYYFSHSKLSILTPRSDWI